jgi:hypothetical protein
MTEQVTKNPDDQLNEWISKGNYKAFFADFYDEESVTKLKERWEIMQKLFVGIGYKDCGDGDEYTREVIAKTLHPLFLNGDVYLSGDVLDPMIRMMALIDPPIFTCLDIEDYFKLKEHEKYDAISQYYYGFDLSRRAKILAEWVAHFILWEIEEKSNRWRLLCEAKRLKEILDYQDGRKGQRSND